MGEVDEIADDLVGLKRPIQGRQRRIRRAETAHEGAFDLPSAPAERSRADNLTRKQATV
jgi:hypothetical protein